jgi:acyl dehydratase
MEQIKFDDVAALQAKVSEEFGPFGGELEVTQSMIDRFAELTGDRQWIQSTSSAPAARAPSAARSRTAS